MLHFLIASVLSFFLRILYCISFASSPCENWQSFQDIIPTRVVPDTSSLTEPNHGYPNSGYPVLLYKMKTGWNRPDRNRIVQLPDIRSNPNANPEQGEYFTLHTFIHRYNCSVYIQIDYYDWFIAAIFTIQIFTLRCSTLQIIYTSSKEKRFLFVQTEIF